MQKISQITILCETKVSAEQLSKDTENFYNNQEIT